MADTENACVGAGSVCYLGEGWNASTASEFKDVGRIADDWSSQHGSSTSLELTYR